MLDFLLLSLCLIWFERVSYLCDYYVIGPSEELRNYGFIFLSFELWTIYVNLCGCAILL